MSFFRGLKDLITGGTTNKKKVVINECIQKDINPSERWTNIGELGDGAFGKVYKVNYVSSQTISLTRPYSVALAYYILC